RRRSAPQRPVDGSGCWKHKSNQPPPPLPGRPTDGGWRRRKGCAPGRQRSAAETKNSPWSARWVVHQVGRQGSRCLLGRIEEVERGKGALNHLRLAVSPGFLR